MEKVLNYIILKPRQKINVNLFEAEKYEPAIVVQQLVGNLIYYSNFGRYETRLAESWDRSDDFTWVFKIKKNLKCENGEIINAESFKRSIEKSLYIFEKKGGVPILTSLVGYKNFIDKNKEIKNISSLFPIAGIVSEGDYLKFKFDKKIKSGFLQILSFSPFGYICADNFDSEGNWKDNLKFISSGPYKLSSIKEGIEYQLVRNPNWTDYSSDAPDRIIVSHDDSRISIDQPVIIDAFTNEYKNDRLMSYRLVPEYINSVLIGNIESGYFKDQATRIIFKKEFDIESEKLLPLNFGVNTRSKTFYPNQQVSKREVNDISDVHLKIPLNGLLIEGDIPIEGTSRWHSWVVLKSTLEKLKLDYKFVKNKSTFEEMTSKKYDLRIRGSSIGGGVEAWGLFVSFCSSMGINFPDPGGKICKLIEAYEADKVSDEELSNKFLELVNNEAAILPVSHYGVQMYISKNIDATSFSPLLAIMKFDQIRISQ